jgi:hypothetical protein
MAILFCLLNTRIISGGAIKYLKYDSNKTALWELNERLIRFE